MQFWRVRFHDRPDDLVIDQPVVVRDPIAHAFDQTQWDFRMIGQPVLAEPFEVRGQADYVELAARATAISEL